MNQILINKKLYVTPELKRKKKVYRFHFILSIFLLIVLVSLCIYAEYDRNKSEETSQQILSDVNKSIEEQKQAKSDVLVVVLNNSQEDLNVEALTSKENETPQADKYTTESGYTYYTIATISIPKIDVNYSIIEGETGSEKETEELLKKSPCKLEGPEPNKRGNFCIVGHNYRNTKFFSKVPTLQIGDTFTITDLTGKTIEYKIYKTYEVVPEDTSCLNQVANGKREVTLITCTNDSKKRVIVKAQEVK